MSGILHTFEEVGLLGIVYGDLPNVVPETAKGVSKFDNNTDFMSYLKQSKRGFSMVTIIYIKDIV